MTMTTSGQIMPWSDCQKDKRKHKVARLVWEFDCLHFAQYILISLHGIDCKQTWCKKIYHMDRVSWLQPLFWAVIDEDWSATDINFMCYTLCSYYTKFEINTPLGAVHRWQHFHECTNHTLSETRPCQKRHTHQHFWLRKIPMQIIKIRPKS